MQPVTIYTDGACSGNPGPGGWGALLMYPGNEPIELSGGEAYTTNNRMELIAAINAISTLRVPHEIKIYSDSAYLVNCFNQKWYVNWQKNGWKNSKRQLVENRELWEELIAYNSIHKITWIKVKGHSDNPYNNRCDELAVAATPRVS